MIAIQSAEQVVRLIEKERIRLGVSQRKLCAEAGLSHGAYWFLKHNGGGIHFDTAFRLLKALGATVKVEPQQ
jgi:transcriptional regulator with XRE-family HTH domain